MQEIDDYCQSEGEEVIPDGKKKQVKINAHGDYSTE